MRKKLFQDKRNWFIISFRSYGGLAEIIPTDQNGDDDKD
tara:strand:- start:712 stop:828 length:117 start_codon:yes stop_codon:yes gene_type:complete